MAAMLPIPAAASRHTCICLAHCSEEGRGERQAKKRQQKNGKKFAQSNVIQHEKTRNCK
jgi:hypothetical protein